MKKYLVTDAQSNKELNNCCRFLMMIHMFPILTWETHDALKWEDLEKLKSEINLNADRYYDYNYAELDEETGIMKLIEL